MSLFGYYLGKHGASALPMGETFPFKYEVESGWVLNQYFKIDIWNKAIDEKEPLVSIALEHNGEETFKKINGYFPFHCSSDEVFNHYRMLEKLLKKAKRDFKTTKNNS